MKRIKKGIFILLFEILCITSTVFSQNQPYRPSSIIMPSPTSAALGSFGNIPVSLYNGTPNISIPLYEIKTSNHTLSIGLLYDATGTKVTQDASLVGLGWSLNAGGCVTRITRQKDDLNHSTGYMFTAALPPSLSNNEYDYANGNFNADGAYCDNVYYGQIDAEPDVFSYNFCGNSGRFVIGKSAVGAPVFIDEKNNMDIKYINGGWVFTDGSGYTYYLTTSESSQNYYRSALTELTTLNGLNDLNFDVNLTPTTSWYIDSIVAPTREKIAFTYVRGKSLSMFNKSEQLFKLAQMNMQGGCSSPPAVTNDYHSYDISRQELIDIYLQKIEFTNGKVELKYSNRLDIDYLTIPSGFLQPSKLDSIVVKDAADNFIKGFSFSYSYFYSANTDGRLKLDTLKEFGNNNTLKPPYLFDYYNPTNLPDKYSKSIDHWGYYNAKNNNTLLPSTVLPLAYSSFVGADRDADEVNTYPINGVLKSIQYPTEGKTTFEYELHEYGDLDADQAYKDINKYTIARSNPDINPADNEREVYFTIPPLPNDPNAKVPVTIRCSYQKVNPNKEDLPSFGYSNMWRQDAGGVWRSVAGCQMANYDGTNASPSERTLNLDPGYYHMLVQSTSGWSCSMSAAWIEKQLITQRKGGGIRIKRITDTDNLGKNIIRKYLYQLNDSAKTSSGKLLNTPRYLYSYVISGSSNTIGSGISITCPYSATFYTLVSNSIYSSGLSSKSGIVGYSLVTELLGENGENGKTEYYYNNQKEVQDIIPFIPTVAAPLNGKLSVIKTYNVSGGLLKMQYYTYVLKESNTLKGLKLLTCATIQGAELMYYPRFYSNNSYWVTPDEETETLYSSTGTVTTTKKYYYNNNKHRELSQLDITKSDGNTLITKYKRPDDYIVSGGNSFVEQMRNIHIISPVIEQQTFLKQGTTNKLISGTFSSFSKFNNQFFKPNIVYTLETSVPLSDMTESSFASNGLPSFHPNYKEQVTLSGYNALGNLVIAKENNDLPQSYIYGYNNSLPIAAIKNSLISDIFHTSFEEDGNSSGGDSKTGKKSKTGGFSTTLTGLTNGEYILSYWQKSGGTWTFQKSIVTVSGSSYALSVSGQVDEVRFYPKAARMTTYTYEPLVGMTSQCDENSRITYYEYDGFGRLQHIKDQDGKVIKTMDYQYQQSINQ